MNALVQRVKRRLDDLGYKPGRVDAMVGAAPGFVGDLIKAEGKKKSFSVARLIPLANALECDPDYLLGLQNEVRRPAGDARTVIDGTVEVGAWRSPENDFWRGHTERIAATISALAVDQVAFKFAGSSPDPRVRNLSTLICRRSISGATPGGIIIASQENGGLIERSLWRVSANDGGLIECISDPERTIDRADPAAADAKIEGLVVWVADLI